MLMNVTEVASMGPRPRGRGMGALEFSFAIVNQASMGPRPRGRGMQFRGCKRPHAHSASMGPRPRGRGMLAAFEPLEHHADELQWGRARAGAEWNFVSFRCTDFSTLQWGRARA